MSKAMQTKWLTAEKITSIFGELSQLMPAKRSSIREILESQQSVILAAIERGNSLRDIVNFLARKGLKVSHETLRKIVLQWQEGAKSAVKVESKIADNAMREHKGENQDIVKDDQSALVNEGQIRPGNCEPLNSALKSFCREEKTKKADFEVEPDKESY